MSIIYFSRKDKLFRNNLWKHEVFRWNLQIYRFLMLMVWTWPKQKTLNRLWQFDTASYVRLSFECCFYSIPELLQVRWMGEGRT